MNKKSKRVIALLLSLLILVFALVSCNPEETPPDTPDTGFVEYFTDGVFPYTVVRPEKTTQAVVDCAVTVRTAIDTATGEGSSVDIRDDWIMRGTELDVNALEILIGDTNRAESAALKAKLSGLTFGIMITDTKIVINAVNDIMLKVAVDYFLETYISGADAQVGDNSLKLPAEMLYLSSPDNALTLVDKDGTVKCSVIRPADADTEVRELATALSDAINGLTGARTYVSSVLPTDGTCAILLGDTGATASDAAYVGMKAADWVIRQADGNIVIAAWAPLTLAHAVSEFTEYLTAAAFKKDDSGKAPLYIPGQVDLSGSFEGWADDDIPLPEGGFMLTDADDNAFSMVHFSATVADYETYSTALSASGFEKYTTNTIGSNLFSTWSGANSVVNLSLGTGDNTMRIVVDPLDNTALPAKSPESFTKSTDVLLTQVGLTYGSVDCGMSYSIRLGDGTFIVIDGGWNEEGEPEKLYGIMKEQTPSGEPVVSAWIFTHAHKDHIGCYTAFASKYGKQVAVKSVIYDFPCYDQLVTSDSTGLESYISDFPTYAGYFKDDTTVYRARTGQKYYFADAVVEILYTFEDLTPKTLTYFNDTSLVFSVEIAGQRIMFLGDASQQVNAMLTGKYGTYLKSDFVQVAHHGYSGGTVGVYTAIDPAWVLFPTPAFRYEVFKNDNISGYLLNSLHVKECFVSGHGTTTLKLPYGTK